MPALRAYELKPPEMPWPASLDVHDQDGDPIVTAEPTPLGPAEDDLQDPATGLDRLIPAPRLAEIDRLDLDAPPATVWERVRHGSLAPSPLIRALFTIRTRGRGKTSLAIDELTSSPEKPGFQLLVDEPSQELAVGAIGKVWEPEIPFVHVATAAEFAAFDRPGFAKVAWAIRLSPGVGGGTHLELEVRVATTDEASWPKFRRYFLVIGPGSRFIRHLLLRSIGRDLGILEIEQEDRSLPGDDLLPDAAVQQTDGIDIGAAPEAIWPWLVQMGCGRAGYYSYDFLDNGGVRSAREIHPELQRLSVGDVLPAAPGRRDGFEVLRLEPPRLLVLGGLFDAEAGEQLPFAAQRPRRYRHVTWAFVLEPLGRRSTRLTVRARAASSSRRYLLGARFVHRFMEAEQLRQLAARAEGRLARED